MTKGLRLLVEAPVVGFRSMPVRAGIENFQSNSGPTRSIRVGRKVGNRGDLPERCQA